MFCCFCRKKETPVRPIASNNIEKNKNENFDAVSPTGNHRNSGGGSGLNSAVAGRTVARGSVSASAPPIEPPPVDRPDDSKASHKSSESGDSVDHRAIDNALSSHLGISHDTKPVVIDELPQPATQGRQRSDSQEHHVRRPTTALGSQDSRLDRVLVNDTSLMPSVPAFVMGLGLTISYPRPQGGLSNDTHEWLRRPLNYIPNNHMEWCSRPPSSGAENTQGGVSLPVLPPVFLPEQGQGQVKTSTMNIQTFQRIQKLRERDKAAAAKKAAEQNPAENGDTSRSVFTYANRLNETALIRIGRESTDLTNRVQKWLKEVHEAESPRTP